MALGMLFLLFVGMGVLAIVGTALLFLIKNEKATDIFLVGMTAYSLVIAYMGATAKPSNFILEQVICWVIGFVAIAGTGMRFITKKQSIISKLLVVSSVFGGIIYTFLL